MFGPWGAVIGAAAAVLGALATAFWETADAEKEAQKALKEYEKALDNANQILLTSTEYQKVLFQQKLSETQATIEATQATDMNTLAHLRRLQVIRQEVDAYNAAGFDDLSFIGAAPSENLPAKNDIQDQITALEAKIRQDTELLRRLNDPNERHGDDPTTRTHRGKTEAERAAEKLRREQEAAAEKFAREFIALEGKLDPATGALIEFRKEQSLLDKAMERGFYTFDEYDKRVEQLKKRYEEVLDPVGKAMKALNDQQGKQRASLEAEAATIGMTNDQRRIYLAGVEAEIALKEKNVPLTDKSAQAYIAEAQAQAQLQNEIEQGKREREELEGFYDSMIDKSGDFIASLAKGEQSFRNWREAGTEALNEIIDLFVELSKNEVKNNLALGGDTGRPTLASVGQMFGFGGPANDNALSPSGTYTDPMYVTVTNPSGGPGGGQGGMPGSGGMPGGGFGTGAGIGSTTMNPWGAGTPGVQTMGDLGRGGGGVSTIPSGNMIGSPSAGGGFNMIGAGIGAGIGGTAGYFLGDAIGGKTGGTVGAILGTLLGAFVGAGFESGGVMTSRGPMALRRYEYGGIADHPQVAMFGEGSTPEAYVPLQDGRSIPVTMRGSNDNRRDNRRTSITINLPPASNGFGYSPYQIAQRTAERAARTLR